MSDFGAIWTPAALGNYDASRLPVDLIVVHHTACPLSAAQARFDTPGAQVSAHFIVAQDGRVFETVPIGDTAYDTGDYRTNERSVGIEHESGRVGQDFFTDVQYAASAALIRAVAAHFGFPVDDAHVWPHNRVVPTTCPGVLAVGRLIAGANQPLEEEMRILKVGAAAYKLDGLGGVSVIPDIAVLGAYLDAGVPQKDVNQSTIDALTKEIGDPLSAILRGVLALQAHPSVAGDTQLSQQVAVLETALRAAGASLQKA